MSDTIYPRLKSTAPAFRLGDRVAIGGTGVMTEIPDPDGSIGCLLDLCDGTRSISDVHAQLASVHSAITLSEVTAAIEPLDAAGFLENAALGEGVLDDYSTHRWARNLTFFEAYANLGTDKFSYQRRLQEIRVGLLGVGGLGSHLLYDLAAAGVLDIRIVDFDTVDLSNLNRQIIYTEADLGRPKCEVAEERIRAFSPRLSLDAVQARITCAEDVRRLVEDRDIVISVVDRPAMSVGNWVNAGCVAAGVPYIAGGVETNRAVYYSVIPGQSGCVECWRAHVADVDPPAAALLDEQRRLSFEGNPAAFGPLVSLLTGCMVSEFIRFATGIAPLLSPGRLMELRFDDLAMFQAECWPRDPRCPVCAHGGAPRH